MKHVRMEFQLFVKLSIARNASVLHAMVKFSTANVSSSARVLWEQLLLRHSGTLSKQIKEMYCARHERGNSESSNTTGAAEKRAKSGRIRVGREACGAAKNLYVKNVRCEYMIYIIVGNYACQTKCITQLHWVKR